VLWAGSASNDTIDLAAFSTNTNMSPEWIIGKYERAQIDEAVATVRRYRPVALGMPRSRPPLPDVQLARPA
jgi:hypothetical protein